MVPRRRISVRTPGSRPRWSSSSPLFVAHLSYSTKRRLVLDLSWSRVAAKRRMSRRSFSRGLRPSTSRYSASTTASRVACGGGDIAVCARGGGHHDDFFWVRPKQTCEFRRYQQNTTSV